MADFSALPLYTDAYLADTGHLSTEEHGAYLLLLITAWRAPGCRLKDDDRYLARVAKAPEKRWIERLRPTLAEFFTIENGFWSQKKLSEVRLHVEAVREKRRGAAFARHGAKPLEDKHSGIAKAGADALLSNNSISPKGDTSSPSGSSARPRETPEPELPLADAKPKAKRPKAAATRIPTDWLPNDEDFDFAHKEGLSDAEIPRVADNFRDHYLGASGPRAVSGDWSAVWRKWVRREVDQRPRVTRLAPGAGQGRAADGGRAKPSGTAAAIAACIARRRDVG